MVWGSGGDPGLDFSPRHPLTPNAAVMARNSALGAVTALLLGLMGAVLGGWMASGEPMTLTYRRKTFTNNDSREEVRANGSNYLVVVGCALKPDPTALVVGRRSLRSRKTVVDLTEMEVLKMTHLLKREKLTICGTALLSWWSLMATVLPVAYSQPVPRAAGPHTAGAYHDADRSRTGQGGRAVRQAEERGRPSRKR